MKSQLDQLTLDFHDNAEIYDAINDFHHDFEFWNRWCKKSGQSVLELCCGTGRIGIPLIKAGFDYCGIDNSKAFLKSAKSKASELSKANKDVFKLGDMRSFKLNKRFDSIIIAFNALSHLYSLKDIEKCFSSVRKHLKKDSLFMFTVFVPNPHFLARDPKKRHSFSDRVYKTKSGLSFSLTENNIYDNLTQINHIKWYYKILGKRKEEVKDLTMRMFYPEELLALLNYNGFEIVKRFGDFDESPFESKSLKQIIVAKLKK